MSSFAPFDQLLVLLAGFWLLANLACCWLPSASGLGWSASACLASLSSFALPFFCLASLCFCFLLACLLPISAGLLLLLARAFSASGFWLLLPACFLLASCFASSFFLASYFFVLGYLASGRDGGGWRQSPLALIGWLAGWDVARMSRAWCHMSLARQPGSSH